MHESQSQFRLLTVELGKRQETWGGELGCFVKYKFIAIIDAESDGAGENHPVIVVSRFLTL